MEYHNIFRLLSGALLPWYENNKRDLPWRTDKDPYHIWVSEIMLQQTRVEAVKGYYGRFLSVLPTIEALSKADDAQLQKLWEGLGYYSRVRNLKKAAINIMEHHGGVFPAEYEQILALPGVGEYTAGAICSIAFGQPTPAVDGNVLRVVSRLTDNDSPIDSAAYKKSVRDTLAAVYPAQAGEFTQALMELGATVCGPNRKPECCSCPCKRFCMGYQNGTAENLPVKSPKTQRRIEEKTVFVLSCDGKYALEKRPAKGLLAGLWQFPNTAGKLEINETLDYIEQAGLQAKQVFRQMDKKHIFTHIQWNVRGVYLEVTQQNNTYTWLTKDEINTNAALPTAFRQFWEEIEHV